MEKREAKDGPIILSCMTNLERSCYVLITITCVLALESEAPVIISKWCDRARWNNVHRSFMQIFSQFNFQMQMIFGIVYAHNEITF